MQSVTSFNPMMSYQVDLMTDADDDVTAIARIPSPGPAEEPGDLLLCHSP
jgi:hypothetical protein